MTNQVELHPFFVQEKLREFSSARGVVLTGYSPLGAAHGLWARPDKAKNLLRDPRLEAIGEKYGKGAAQVVLRWMVSLWAAFYIAVVNNAINLLYKQNVVALLRYKKSPRFN